jgi:hypothetical protein
MTVTADRFLEGLKRRVTVPANDELLNDTGLLAIGDDVMREELVPLLLSVNENHFVTEPYTQAMVADQDAYDIPYRSVARGLRDLKLVNASDPSQVSDMQQVTLEEEHLFPRAGLPASFYFRGDQIVVVPVPIDTSYSLKIWYNLKPGSLCQVTSAARVTAVGATTVTCSSLPTTMLAGVTVDFIKATSGCRTLALSKAITNATATDLTFAAGDVPTGLAVGDYVSLAETSPVVQIPDEAYPYFETLCASRVCDAIGDLEVQQALEAKAQRQKESLLKILAPRIEGAAKKIVNRNGLLRGRGFSNSSNRRGYYL